MSQPKKRRVPLWKKAALTALLTTALIPAGTVSAGAGADRLGEVLELLSTAHVSGVTEEALSNEAIKAMVESLKDPYTQYMSKEEWAGFLGGLGRQFVGIGVQITKSEEGIYIEQVFTGTPAAGAELMRNDIIVKVNDAEVTDQTTTNDLVQLIMGEENTDVTITVRRDNALITKTMKRKAVSLPVVESSYLDGGVGYVKVHTFSDDSAQLFAAKLAEIKQKSDFHALVVDLRGNPGGLLSAARSIASNFVKEGVLIHTKTRTGTDEPVMIAGGSTLNVPVYVLVNENSASASEVLAGALQDYGAAVIIGTQSYGKGSVQNVFSLSDGSVLKVTVEEYLTPKGNPVNKVGITPDVKAEGDLNQLLSALHLAGVKNLQVSKDRSVLTVNGMQVNDRLPVLEQDGRLWVHSRVLAAMVGAKLEWLPEVSGVQLTTEGAAEKPVFSLENGKAMQAGDYLFLDAAAFAKQYPQLQVSGDATKLELIAAAGN